MNKKVIFLCLLIISIFSSSGAVRAKDEFVRLRVQEEFILSMTDYFMCLHDEWLLAHKVYLEHDMEIEKDDISFAVSCYPLMIQAMPISLKVLNDKDEISDFDRAAYVLEFAKWSNEINDMMRKFIYEHENVIYAPEFEQKQLIRENILFREMHREVFQNDIKNIIKRTYLEERE